MKKIICLFVFLLSSVSYAEMTSNQQPIYYQYSTNAGYPYGWGYVSYPYWPADYWLHTGWNGYSYYGYYNYQPYYSSFGVISFSPETGKWGSSWGQPSRQYATAVANGNCSEATCKPVVWVQGGCASVITSATTKKVSWGVGYSRAQADQAALNICKSAAEKPTDCKELAWICSN